MGPTPVFLIFLFAFVLPAVAVGAYLLHRLEPYHRLVATVALAVAAVSLFGVPVLVWLAEQAGVPGFDPSRYRSAWEAAGLYLLLAGTFTIPVLIVLVAATAASTRPLRWPACANAALASVLLLLVPWLAWYRTVYRYDPRTCAHECYPELLPMFIWFAGLIFTLVIGSTVAVLGAQRRNEQRRAAAW